MGDLDLNGPSIWPPNWTRDQGDIASKSFVVDIKKVTMALLSQEDKSRNGNITIDDTGPKSFSLRATNDDEDTKITGTYFLSNFLQELTLAEKAGHSVATIAGAMIVENPVDRIGRRITDTFWKSLTRRMDRSSIGIVAQDSKVVGTDPRPRIYVPVSETQQYNYYSKLSIEHPDLRLDVQYLPQDFLDPKTSRMLRAKPGILAMAMDSNKSLPHALQYIVPGGRFNELYGWDSYFTSLGLLESGRVDLARDIVYHFIFMINHYGCILNANRTYYLGRSQPPFLTDLVLRTYNAMDSGTEAEEFLRLGFLAAIKEYHRVWVSSQRRDPITGLSRYRPGNHGLPPEVEPGHYDWILGRCAKHAGMTIDDLSEGYINGTLKNEELDEFLSHDWAVRESGHDTSYRVESICADLATVDLNALLYKYETDIAWAIENKFNGRLEVPTASSQFDLGKATIGKAEYWNQQAHTRKLNVDKYLWNAKASRFHDYNTATKSQTPYESITAFWALWSGLASQDQANQMVANTLPKFEHIGGALSTTPQPEEPNGPEVRPRQWDYPFGWAPHQMLLWDGLRRYGFEYEAKRLAYRWLYLITSIAANYNGMVLERYDVTKLGWAPGKDAEYENQGCNFRGVPMEGFGWTNASYVYGLKVLDENLLSNLRRGNKWENIDSSNGCL